MANNSFRITILITVFFALILSGKDSHAQASYYSRYGYGAYGHYPVGSVRVLAMGGAFTGLADDASAVQTNPAGLSLTRYTFDFSSGTDRIVSRETSINSSDSSDKFGIPYTDRFYSIATRWGRFGLGAGIDNPYELNASDDAVTNARRQLFIKDTEISAALRIVPEFSIGATYHTETAELAYVTSNKTRIFEKKDTFFVQFGALFKPTKDIGMGVNFVPGRRFDFNEKNDDKIQALESIADPWFRDVLIPRKLTLGLTFKTGYRLRWVGDIDFISKVDNAIVVGGQEFIKNNIIIPKNQTIIHGGYELNVVRNNKFEFNWRGGGYREPPRFQESPTRNHFTMGVEVRFGYVVVAASYDQATDFSNVAQSVSLSLGEI